MIFLLFILIMFGWTSRLADWRVVYATGIAQFAIWLSLISLLNVTSLFLQTNPVVSNATYSWKLLRLK